MPIVESAIDADPACRRVFINVDRFQLQKCRFRCKAEDGRDFAFSLEVPLKHGDCVYATDTHCYELRQLPEKVLRITLPETPSDAAQLAWQIGNLHQPVDIRERDLLVGDDPALRRILKKLDVKFDSITDIFSPPPHSAYPAHQHVPGLEYDHSHFFGATHSAV
jgi:urease accessory protein